MACCRFNRDLVRDLASRLGETVTIFTTSGGRSGDGFTGVLISVNCEFVRLLSDIGPAPACALGSCCDRGKDDDCDDDFEEEGLGGMQRGRSSRNRRINCGGRNVGAIVDIPVNRIAAFVHNTLS